MAMKIRITMIFLCWIGLAQAQSPHFSQFYSSPLLINPAFTGYTEGAFRVAGNYRSQWGSGGSPYSTTSLSVEVSPLRDKLAAGNKLGFGIAALSDKTLEGAVQFNSISFSTAYNLSLDPDNVHTIGLGLQGVYSERRINFNKLNFENQLTSGGFDISLPIGEELPGGNRNYFDMSTGAAYHASLPDKSFFAGVSVYNLLKKKDVYNDPQFQLPKRYTAVAGGNIDVGYSGIFYFSLNYQQQGSTNETTLGSAYGIQLGDQKKNIISLGAWYRVNDAVIPYIGYQLEGFQTGFSFDYTTSKLKTGGQTRNGFEISMVYTAPDNSEMKRLVPWY